MRLHDDETRCHDGKCLLREECERWLQRGTQGDNVQHSTTLKPMNGDCQHQIRPGPFKTWFKEGRGHD